MKFLILLKKIIQLPFTEFFEIIIRLTEIYPNTKIGYFIRNIILKNILYKYGSNNFISSNVSIRGRKKIFISSSVHIATNTFIGSDKINGIYIGNNVHIGPNCVLRSSNKKYMEEMVSGVQNYSEVNLKKDNVNFSLGIIIEDNVWIGANCTILSGSHIKEGSVIGANSLVNDKLESKGIYVGSPVKKIKNA